VQSQQHSDCGLRTFAATPPRLTRRKAAIVVKADGLAAGKASWSRRYRAQAAIDMMFGSLGKPAEVIIEEFLR
jgi:phosphoribosylamine-glycine ligase